MEDTSSSEQLLIDKRLNRQLLENATTGQCIICRRKAVRLKKNDRKYGGSEVSSSRGEHTKMEETLQKVALKTVMNRPGFLKTFNQVWRVLNGSSDSDGEISLETVITEGPGSKGKFSKAPLLCERCCEKVLAVENMMKAVSQQVREIKMLLEESKKKQLGMVEGFDEELESETVELNADVEIKDEKDDWHWQESSSACLQSSIKDDPESSKEMEVECDEDLPNSLDDQNEVATADDDDIEDNEEDEDDSNWEWVDDDLDYIKSEQDDESNEEENEESTSEEELEEEPLTLVENQNSPDILNDPLEIYSSSAATTSKKLAGKINPEDKHICSCDRRFPTHQKMYNHKRTNKTVHPDFKHKLREIRSELEGGQPCDICGEPVKLINILEHLAGHLEGGHEYVVKCPNFNECGHAFTHAKDFTGRHLWLKRFENGKTICEKIKFGLRCETCGYTTDHRYRLSNHVTNEHERGTLPKNLKCPISGCGKMFAVKQSIFLHLHAHRTELKVNQNCDKCGEDLKVEEMEGHLKDKHGVNDVIGCKQCPLKFEERDAWVEHLWEHRDIGLSCDICGDGDDKPVKYLKYSEFRDHYWGIHKLCPKRYKCGQCENRCYWMKKELDKHLENHRKDKRELSSSLTVNKKANKKKLNKCDICDGNVSYGTMADLISHNIRIHGADPFKCDICGETFHQKATFSRHVKEHAGIVFQKEWKCEVDGCRRIFKDKKGLKGHKKARHGGVKRHVCQKCGKGFAFPQTLKKHRDAVHLGLRPLGV